MFFVFFFNALPTLLTLFIRFSTTDSDGCVAGAEAALGEVNTVGHAPRLLNHLQSERNSFPEFFFFIVQIDRKSERRVSYLGSI